MKRRNRKRPMGWLLWLLVLAAAGICWFLLNPGRLAVKKLEQLQVPDYVDVQIIDIDGESRRGTSLEAIESIVIHYVGNPGTSAQANRGWFANPESTVSSHFIVGLEGEVIQCIPLHEKSSASNHRNADTISIEVCHPDHSGKFNAVTYRALVELTAWLVDACGLEVEDVIRHYDVTGKECPRWFVRDEEAWLTFKAHVKEKCQ